MGGLYIVDIDWVVSIVDIDWVVSIVDIDWVVSIVDIDLNWVVSIVDIDWVVSIGSFHIKSSDFWPFFHGPPPILLKFGTLVELV